VIPAGTVTELDPTTAGRAVNLGYGLVVTDA
jgi:hypothetical protein